MLDHVRSLFPRLIACTDGKGLQADLKLASEILSRETDEDPLRGVYEARRAGQFKSGLLTYYLAAECLGDRFFEVIASSIEADLNVLDQHGLLEDARQAYGEKLRNDDSFDTVRCEIAAAAIFVTVLDAGSARLEEPLPDSDKNSDISGKWHGRPTRVEVTTISENWPPVYDEDVRAVAESASIPAGYFVYLNIPLTSRNEANRVKYLIERLYAAGLASPGQDVQVDQYRFRSEGGAYRCATAGVPFHYIEFVDDVDIREAQGTAFSRATLSRSQRNEINDEFPVPEGVITLDAVPTDSRSHRDVPASKKAYDVVQWKLEQCVAGSVNLIVIGQTQPWNDSAIGNAMIGSPFLTMRLQTSGETRTVTDAQYHRTMTGPFADINKVPAQSRHLIEGAVEEFQPASAVLAIRIDPAHPLAAITTNANASVPISDVQAKELLDAAKIRVHRRLHGLREDHIAVAAYYIWEKEGRCQGKDREHWDRAISQLLLARCRS